MKWLDAPEWALHELRKRIASGVYRPIPTSLPNGRLPLNWGGRRSVQLAVRRRYRTSDKSDPSDPYGLATATPEAAANTLICLINQASYLLGRFIHEPPRHQDTKDDRLERYDDKSCQEHLTLC